MKRIPGDDDLDQGHKLRSNVEKLFKNLTVDHISNAILSTKVQPNKAHSTIQGTMTRVKVTGQDQIFPQMCKNLNNLLILDAISLTD